VCEVGAAWERRKRVIPSHPRYGCGEVTPVAFKAEQRTAQRVADVEDSLGARGG
jgi:hypothetical protein